MSMYRHHSHDVPELNTSSLPDLIFSVLFFFMIVTHMRTDLVKVRYQVPQAKELKKLAHKSTVTHIYIGKEIREKRKEKREGFKGKGGRLQEEGTTYVIQVNDKVVTAEELTRYLQSVRAAAAPADQQNLTANISADRHAPMGLITDVKQALRKAGILKVTYTGIQAKNASVNN